jgi:hypothetical protein
MSIAQHVVNAILDAAVMCLIVFPEKGQPTSRDILSAHREFAADQATKAMLVTSLDRLPIMAAPPSAGGAAAATKSSEEASQLLEVLRVFLQRLNAPAPADLGEAIDATLRLLTAVQCVSGSGGASSSYDIRPLLDSIRLDDCNVQKDPALLDALRVMRLLFTDDLAALQNYGSAMIAQLQAFTATCKTDSTLGSVGK